MLKLFKRTPLTLVAVLLYILSPTGFAEEIKISTLNFCPLHCMDNSAHIALEQPGAVIEIYKKIYGAAGHTVKFSNLPFDRGMALVHSGELDAISLVLKFSEQALKDKIRQLPKIGYIYGELIYTNKTTGIHQSSCFYTRAGSPWKYHGIESFKGLTFGVANAYDYGPEMNAYLERMRNDSTLIQELSGDNVFVRNLRKLVKKRIDIMLADRVSGSYAIKQSVDQGIIPAQSVKLSGCIGKHQKMYLGFTSKRPERSKKLAAIFDKGIEILRASGELEQLLKQYGLTDWVEPELNPVKDIN